MQTKLHPHRALALAAALAIGAVGSTTPSALKNVSYGAFTQTATYSVANQLGFFTAYGLNVTFLQIPNSTYGYSALLAGGYDIVTGTIDNAVNLRFNSNASLTVVGQLDQGPELTIAAVPNNTDITQLKGLPVIVDSPVSGYAYIIRKVLSLFGLRLEDGDYSFEAVGSTAIRYTDLVAGELPDGSPVYATLLTYPFSSEAAFVGNASQPNILATVKDELPGGNAESPAMTGAHVTGKHQTASSAACESYFIEAAQSLQSVAQMLIFVTGGIRRKESLEAVLSTSTNTLAGMSTAMGLVPDLPYRWAHGDDVIVRLSDSWILPGVLKFAAGIAVVEWNLHRIGNDHMPWQGIWPALALLLSFVNEKRQMAQYRKWIHQPSKNN